MTEPSPAPSLLRRLLWPVLGSLPAILGVGSAVLSSRLEVMLEYTMELRTAAMFGVMFSMVFLLIWFAFFSGINWVVRGSVLALLTLMVVTLVLITAKLEFSGDMVPRFVFVWQTTAEKNLEEYLAKKEKSSDQANLAVGPTDSPQYRGPKGDGTALHLKINPDWAANPPKLLWKHPVGIGHGGVAVAGNSAITMEQRGSLECVVCYDRQTGKERWMYGFEAHFKQSEPMGGDGPRTTPLIHEGHVIALGATGELYCLDGSNGQRRWQANIIQDAKADNIDWGMSGSPIIVGNMVIVNPGTNKDRTSTGAVAGYDLSTGKKVWGTGNRTAGYASPMAAQLGGVKQALAFDGLALAGFDPQTGAELWKQPWATAMNMNSAQPVVVGEDRVFIGSEKSNGGAMFQVKKDGDKWTVTEAWKNRFLSARYANPILVKDHLIGLSEGRLVCLDAKTGKRKWAEGNFGNGQMILTQNAILLTAESGKLFCIDANPEEFKILGELEVFDARTWNVPALAGNQVFIRNHRELAVYELSELK